MSSSSLDGAAPDEGRRRPSPFTRLAITVAAEGERAELIGAGELDATGGAELCAAAERLIGGTCRQVLLDVSAITRADLAGVRALAEVGAMLERAGVELTIRNANAATYPVDWQAISRSRRD